jgi:hypothetical protein
MYARVATFQGDPSQVDDAIGYVRGQTQDQAAPPPGLEDAKGMYMLVDRESGKGLSVVLFDSEDGMRRGHEALDAMTPPGASGRRSSVEFYEVPVSFTR